MAEILKVLKGTKDILPQDMEMWHFLEEKANEVFSQYGFKEIRTPIIEVTELFSRGVGDTTDIVNKEMYTFEKSDRSLSTACRGIERCHKSLRKMSMASPTVSPAVHRAKT